MDRNREGRRTSTISSSSNGLTRRRHRTSLRDSPEEDGVLDMQETRLRDRGSGGKKDRERDRDRDRERDRDRMNRNNSSSSKRRRGDNRSMSMREGGVGEESSEESVNDDEEDEEDDGHLRIMQQPQQQGQGQGQQGQGTSNISQSPSLSASSLSNHNGRRTFPLLATTTNKVFSRPTWKDEMIGVSVPRKARSASTKRSHDCWVSSSSGGGHGGSVINNPNEQNFRQASTSPVRTSLGMSGSPVRPVSPSSSNASARKKLKPNGPKQRPPKSGPKTTSMATSSSAQDEIEMEIAEVLYGLMRQPQANSQSPQAQAAQSTKTEMFESREENSKDAKSRISSPVSNSGCGVVIGVQSSSILAQNSSSSVTPVSAIAPKRKKPRPVKYDDDNQSMSMVRNSPISSTTKSDIDQAPKMEALSPNSDKPRTDNGGPLPDATAKSQTTSEAVKPEINSVSSDAKPVVEESENQDAGVAREVAASPKRESTPSVVRLEHESVDTSAGVATEVNPSVAESESMKEEKFHIDLMAPPPLRSSPERDGGEIDFTAANPKPMTADVKPEVKSLVKEDEKSGKAIKEEVVINADASEVKAMAVDVETHKALVHKEKSIDLRLDLEKNDTATAGASAANNKQNQNNGQNQNQNQPVMKQQQQPLSEKAAQPTTSLPFPMSVAGWPGGLPPMGYMSPLQGVVSMDGSTVASAAIQPPQLIFNQPRPKRCATHCYIARNISCHQQFMRMNPFWSAAATSASLYGAKPCNLNVLPSTELHGNTARGPSPMPDKSQNLAIFPGQPGKDKGSPVTNNLDAAQRKQILPQQSLPAGAPSGIMPSAAFIFPLSQQQAAAAASIRPASLKSTNAGNTASNASNSAASSASAAAAATALSFNYSNIPGGETQYLAILQNNPYPFPVPAHVGAAPAYRGTHAQAVPFFNGSFYSSQMLHPSQQAPAPTQTQQPSHPNASISSGSSSSHKQLQNQQPRQHHGNGGNGSLQGFPSVKSPPSQQQSQHVAHQARQLDSDIGGEDSPSTADSRVSRANMNIYSQNFPMAIRPQNFALMAPAQMASAKGGASNPNEKKQQMLSQQHGPKTGMELPSQAFAVSFASMNSSGSAPGLDISSIAQSHAILQSLPEATRQGYQMMASAAAAQSAQQKKNYRPSDEAKIGANEALNEDDRKQLAGKTPVIAFSRPDFADAAVSALQGSGVVDSSARTLNMGSAASRTSSVMPGVVNNLNAPASQQQLQRNHHHQQQQMIQLTKQQQYAAAAAAASAARSKTPTSNGSVYTDLPSSSAHSKYPNALTSFPQNIVQSSSSQTPSPQWKSSSRTSTPQVPSPLTSASSTTHKNLPQAQGRNPPGQTQISFASNSKSSNVPPGQQLPSNNQSSSPPLVVGSPTNSSMSKSAGGSPRTTTSSSTSNKPAQASSLSSQQGKSSPTVASRKSPPVGGGNVSSILVNSHMNTSSSGGTKHQSSQQQQINKQALQQNQLFFSHSYVQVQPPHTNNSTSAASVASNYYLQRRPPDQPQKSPQPQGTLTSSSSAMLSLASATTCDPVKAVAASASNMKGGGVPSQGIVHAAQFAVAQSSGNPHQIVPAGFPYVHAVPNAVQVKPAEQKQPAA